MGKCTQGHLIKTRAALLRALLMNEPQISVIFMHLNGVHSPSGLSLGLQIAAFGRRKARENGKTGGGMGKLG